MNSRERVLRVFNHQEADKVPVDFGGTVVTCLDYYAHKNLKKHLKINDDNDPIIDYTMGTVEPCDQLKCLNPISVEFHLTAELQDIFWGRVIIYRRIHLRKI